MRFMMIVKATHDSEAGVLPSGQMLAQMGAFNAQMMAAGILRDAAGLRPSADGARVTFANGETVVTDGPFTETKELIAGFWLIEVGSTAEAVAWARRCPPPHGATPAQIEIRPFYETTDFPEASEELLASEKKLAAAIKAPK